MNKSLRPEILIVDDKPEKILALEAVLSGLSPALSIVSASSGRDALRFLLNRNFAVILLDINMPGMDGFELAALIRQRKTSEHTPIIFITAHREEPMIERSYQLGAVDFITAPVVPEILRSKVQVFVDLAIKADQIQSQARRLEQRATQLSLMAAELTQAEERERRRLASVLHDHLQQLLVSARIRIGMIRKNDTLLSSESGQLSDVDRLLSEAIDASRSLTVELSPPVLYDAGLGPALRWLGCHMKDNHHLSIDVCIEESAEPTQEETRILLFQAARELLFNIVKHAQASHAVVTLDRNDASPDEIRLTIVDDGIGFDPDAQTESITEHYSRKSNRGFGLFSIGERIALVDGRMTIKSNSREGTLICIWIPEITQETTGIASNPASNLPKIGKIDPTDSYHAKLEHRDLEIPQKTFDKTHSNQSGYIEIVVADDHEILRHGLVALIEKQPDMRVVAQASNGKELINQVAEHQPDIAIVDVTMPIMNGIEATRLLSANYPEVAVIGLSMHDEADMAARMCSEGAAIYLRKGGPSEALIAAIRANARSSALTKKVSE